MRGIMERESKVWGQRWLIRKDSTHATSFLKLDEGYRCSWHCHQEKYNLFFVVWGKIGILIEGIDGRRKETILTEGQFLTVAPRQWHEFRVYEHSGVIEEMYVEYSENDIERETKGGKLICS